MELLQGVHQPLHQIHGHYLLVHQPLQVFGEKGEQEDLLRIELRQRVGLGITRGEHMSRSADHALPLLLQLPAQERERERAALKNVP